MAQQITLVDDCNGTTEGVETREFKHHGKLYSIDLGSANWQALVDAIDLLDEFAEKATPVEVKRERKETALGRLSTEDKKQIRADLGKGPRGTIPDDVVETWLRRNDDGVAVGEPEIVEDSPGRAVQEPRATTRGKR